MEKPVQEIHPGKHTVAYFKPRIFFTAYVGDVSGEEAETVVKFTAQHGVPGEPMFFVTDMARQGKYSPEARKVLASGGGGDQPELHICMVNASVMARAAMTLVLTAARLANNANTHLKTFNTVEEAMAYARATSDAWDARKKAGSSA